MPRLPQVPAPVAEAAMAAVGHIASGSPMGEEATPRHSAPQTCSSSGSRVRWRGCASSCGLPAPAFAMPRSFGVPRLLHHAAHLVAGGACRWRTGGAHRRRRPPSAGGAGGGCRRRRRGRLWRPATAPTPDLDSGAVAAQVGGRGQAAGKPAHSSSVQNTACCTWHTDAAGIGALPPAPALTCSSPSSSPAAAAAAAEPAGLRGPPWWQTSSWRPEILWNLQPDGRDPPRPDGTRRPRLLLSVRRGAGRSAEVGLPAAGAAAAAAAAAGAAGSGGQRSRPGFGPRAAGPPA